MNNKSLPDVILSGIPVLLAFLMPVFFLPTTLEFFEYNKLTLLTLATVIMLLTWGVKMLVNREVRIAKSPLDLPLFLLLLVFGLSTFFSIDRYLSLFGAAGRWFPSLAAIIALFSFHYVTSSNMKARKWVRYTVVALVSGITLSSVVGLLGYYGVKLGSASFLQTANFNLTGSAVVTGILAAIAVGASLVMLLESGDPKTKIVWTSSVLLNLLSAVLLGNYPGWIVLAVVLASVVLLANRNILRNRVYLGVIVLFAVVFTGLLVLPATSKYVLNVDYPQEILLSPSATWIIVSSTIRDMPFLGSGVSTFHINFPRYKPLIINSTDQWNIRFDKPNSEVLGMLGATGVIGFGVFLYFLFAVTKVALRSSVVQHRGSQEGDALNTVVAVIVLGSVASLFVYYGTVSLFFVMFLGIASGVALLSLDQNVSWADRVNLSLSSFGSKNGGFSLIGGDDSAGGGAIATKTETFQYLAILPLLAVSVVGTYFTYRNYMAEFLMRQAVLAAVEGNGTRTYELQARAININPRRSSYHNAYAQTNIALANAIVTNAEGDLSENDLTNVQALVSQAIRSARVSTELVAPLSVGGWEIRGGVYRALLGVASDAGQWAIGAYENAVRLDPTNPVLRVDLGGIYYRDGDYLSAANQFRQAVSLKTDYANGRYNFAQALLGLEQYSDALRELELVQGLLDVDSADYNTVAGEIEAIKANPAYAQVAGASDSLPSVDQLEAEATLDAETTSQEPIGIPGQGEVIEPVDNVNLDASVGEESVDLPVEE